VPLSRRRFLEAVALAATAVPLGACAGAHRVTTIGTASFDRPLPIPPVAPARHAADGARVFDLTARVGQRTFRPGRVTETWGYNGDYLGPTLRAARGERVRINVHNALPETTSVHWHGMHLPAAADGGPHQPVEPGRTWSPSWTIDQPATTLWYHPHPHGRTEKHVYRGLAGLFIVDDQPAEVLDLPGTYGVDDIPVIIQDKRFHDDGSFDESDHRPTGLLGDTLLVNGVVTPHLVVTSRLVRLRLLNASTARIYRLGFADDRSFTLIGTDGALLARPHEMDRIQLSPAERAEIVVRMRPADHVELQSYPPRLGTPHDVTTEVGGFDSFGVLELRGARSLTASPPIPAVLADVPRLEPADAGSARTFWLAGRRINGKKMDMDRIDDVVAAGSTETWEVTNLDELPHNFHIHGVQFQALTVDRAPPPPPLTGWKDTIYLPPRVPTQLIMRFAEYTDPAMPYMYHCHLLFHEDTGMMGQYVTVEPGQQPNTSVGPQHHHH